MASELGVLANQPVVIDNGSGILKAGLAGAEQPKCVFPNFVGRPKHKRVMPGSVLDPKDEKYFGAKADEFRGMLKLHYPIAHGVVNDWSEMEAIWNYAYAEMKLQAKEHPVLLTEAPLNPRKNREKAAEIFFEQFNVPAMFVSMQAVLSLYASGRTTGVVLDSGDGVTHVVPIYEGFALPHAVMRSDVAGRDITEYLQLLLRRSGYNFHTTAEKEVVRAIKEQCCYVAYDPQKEEDLELEARNTQNTKTRFTLPDGSEIKVGPERFRAPEILFSPDKIGQEYPGIHELLVHAITKSDLDMRRVLYSRIVLAGGTTLFTGFGERLLNEVYKLAPRDVKIKITAPPERKYSTWIGGSILAALPTFQRMWVSREEFDEEGQAAIHKKTF